MEYPPEFRVLKAARNVGEMFPYYYPAVTRVRFRPDNKSTPTMGINCSLVITYNEIFINKLTDEELTMVVLHEILHYINGHHARYMNNPLKDTMPFKTHNIAMDLEINELITMDINNQRFENDLPEGALRAKDFFPETDEDERESYEEYLNRLKNDMDTQENNQQGKDSDDTDQAQGKMPINDLNLDGYNDKDYKDSLEQLKEECKEHEERSRGTESGYNDINLRIQKRKYRWEQVFQNILTTKITEIVAGFRYRTFEKANRRYVHTPDIILPVFIDRKIKISLAIIMDVSGSMCDITDKMYGVMKSMIDITDISIDITILEVDTDVENIIRGFDLERKTVESKGGGGTDMGAGLLYIRENKMEPDLIVVMTDSETPWPDPPILANKTVVLTDNPDSYNGPYPMYPVKFD
ncbi:MAG: VWA-like domain-containing protein [Treponema sp.]|jgi:predicted metal-dependent peptidase|nr:VWA-like domain-containing protein [Treponema sp.]